MGLILTRRIVTDGYYFKYICAKCGNDITSEFFVGNGSFLKMDWDNIAIVCSCGEELQRQVITFAPLIDKVVVISEDEDLN